MDIVGRAQALYACINFPQKSSSILFQRKSHCVRRRRRSHIPHRRISSAVVSVLGSPPPSVSELEEDDVLSTFFKERELDGDFISKVSDVIWLKRVVKFNDADADAEPELAQLRNETAADENEGGFLMLTRTLEWVAAGDTSAPFNKKIIAKDVQNDSEKRKRLNNLRYEAIKREILLLTIGVGSLCSVYCLLVLSVQAALVPAMVGMFAYKAAALVQVYRDNEDLQLIFPGDDDDFTRRD